VERVCNLRSGDVVEQAGERLVFVCAHQPHPLYPALALVMWANFQGEMTLDALSPMQEVGEVVRSGEDLRGLVFSKKWVTA
jgi:hypothetical protein